jgi:hypothetical protein
MPNNYPFTVLMGRKKMELKASSAERAARLALALWGNQHKYVGKEASVKVVGARKTTRFTFTTQVAVEFVFREVTADGV